MIRFCDREACCVLERELNRSQMLIYFLNGHLNDPVCVLDDKGKYCGHITYRGLLENENIQDAIISTKVVLGDGIWEEARKYFAMHRAKTGAGYEMLPIIDEDQNLISFAYEDSDADRELRMLRELQEKEGALQFTDIYPDYQCVEIQEFNELAYFFARYLSALGILVRVHGELWNYFYESEEEQILDYKCMKIYAEGIWQKTENWLENLLRSVSVEFECIDRTYEENIKSGIIKNADGDREDLVRYLKKSDQIVILGTDNEAQDAYDYFKKNGIEVCCFAEEISEKTGRNLFCRPVLLFEEVMEKYHQAILVDVHEKGSAWGMGKTDFYDCLGYKRNKSFFLLRDYLEVPKAGLKNLLTGQKIVLTGDVFLCEKLEDYFRRNQIVPGNQISYLILQEEESPSQQTNMKTADICELKGDEVCLLVFPEYISGDLWKKSKEREQRAINNLKLHGILNYTNYFSFAEAFIYIENEVKNKYRFQSLRPKKIVIGSHNAYSGNTLIRGLLDEHREILMMSDYNYLSDDLFWVCVSMSARSTEEIPFLFFQWYSLNWKKETLKEIDAFIEKTCQMLEGKSNVTSQELFVIFHEAYSYMYKEEKEDHKILYWEPHFSRRELVDDFVLWLGAEQVSCDILQFVRNMHTKTGSHLRGILNTSGNTVNALICRIVTGVHDDVEKKDYPDSKRIVVRFEDMKCRPKEETEKLCKEWDISWSKSLMHTSIHGETLAYGTGEKEIKDFDLKPVYNLYEEYFSETDRLKIALICMPWQKKHGYPYVDVFTFSRRELQEIFLKEFYFMQRMSFHDKMGKTGFNIKFQDYIRKKLQRVRMLAANN